MRNGQLVTCFTVLRNHMCTPHCKRDEIGSASFVTADMLGSVLKRFWINHPCEKSKRITLSSKFKLWNDFHLVSYLHML